MPIHRNAVRRIDLHGEPPARWQALYDEATRHAEDYQLVRQKGSTPPERVESMVALHEAISDAPPDDPDADPDHWSAERVRSYEEAMAGRHQTLYRVIARHRGTGAWVGQTVLCVDEVAPDTAFQEDTSVVRAHRGHRPGLPGEVPGDERG